MKITVTTDQGIVVDQFVVAEEIGDLTKPLPQQELVERLIQDARLCYLKEVMGEEK